MLVIQILLYFPFDSDLLIHPETFLLNKINNLYTNLNFQLFAITLKRRKICWCVTGLRCHCHWLFLVFCGFWVIVLGVVVVVGVFLSFFFCFCFQSLFFSFLHNIFVVCHLELQW